MALRDVESLVGTAYQSVEVGLLPAAREGRDAHADRDRANAPLELDLGRLDDESDALRQKVRSVGIDAASGQLTPRGHTPTGGRTPRDINLDPTGRILLVANQDSDSVVSFFVDAQTGRLEPTGQSTTVPKPVRVLFAS